MNDKQKKLVTIIVNQDEREVEKEKISYEQVVLFYLNGEADTSAEYLIKYSRGHSDNVSGTLAPGQKVMVQNGMHFRVSGTGES